MQVLENTQIDIISEDFLANEIVWNKDEITEVVQAAMRKYDGLVFSEDDLADAKAARANLNSLKKAISDKRIQIKKQVMEPYEKFEKEVKEVVALIDKPVDAIDKQIKEFEAKQKEEKRQEIEAYFQSINDIENVTFAMVYDERYMNTTYTMKKVKDEVKLKVDKIKVDLEAISRFDEDFAFIAKDNYFRTLDINKALNEAYRIRDLKQAEAAKKAKQEAERAAMEEAKKHEAEAKKAIEEERIKQLADKLVKELNAPETDPVEEKLYTITLTMYGTKSALEGLKQYMLDNVIRYEKGVRV